MQAYLTEKLSMLSIQKFVLGPVATNAYLIADTDTGDAVVIDPGGDGHLIVRAAEERSWQIRQIWLTHAHFDHLGGVGEVVDGSDALQVGLHPDDLPLWKHKGGAAFFGMDVDPGPEPTLVFQHGQILQVGSHKFEVRHAPGHTRGHVIFYCEAEKLLFSGDVIFQWSIGRTDLPCGDFNTLMNSIRQQVLTLPDETRILSGHGPETTVEVERLENVYLG